MGTRFRKSVKLAPGVRVNFGKKSSSISFGGKGARYTVSTTGRKTSTVGVPGTGLSYVHTSGSKHKEVSGSGGAVVHSPKKYKVCGIILLIIAVISLLIGLLSLSVGGVVFLILGLPCLLLGRSYLKKGRVSKEAESPDISTP
jgi:Flp pilus assembly protein TadB